MRGIILLVVLFLAGCRTGAVEGLSLSLGSYERGLWFDQDERKHQANGVGLKFDIVAGKMIRPVPKFWQPANNPWKGGEPWFVIRSPMVGPYVSLAVGDLGLYFGFKTFKVENEHRCLERYGRWLHDSEFPEPNAVHYYLQPTLSLRRTRWK